MNSHIAKSGFLMSIIFVMANSRSLMPLHWLESTVQIKSWSDGLDCIVISHIAISRFLMSIIFDMSNSRSPKLRQGLESTVQIWSWFNGCDLSRDFACREIGIPVALFLWHFQHVILETPKWCPSADVSQVDGLDHILIWWLRLRQEFAYREIGIPIALFLWHFQNAILETPINGSDVILIWWLRLRRAFVSPLLLALLNIVQVFLNPTVVGPCASI